MQPPLKTSGNSGITLTFEPVCRVHTRLDVPEYSGGFT